MDIIPPFLKQSIHTDQQNQEAICNNMDIEEGKKQIAFYEKSSEFQTEIPSDEETESDETGISNYLKWKYFQIPVYGLLYCISSISAVFLNKVLLSKNGKYEQFESVEFLMFIQSIIGVIELLIFKRLQIIEYPIFVDFCHLTRITCVNFFFIIMTIANAYTVRFLSIPMVALLKNCQVALVCLLEYVLLSSYPGKASIISLIVIILGSIMGSMTDLEFNIHGYIAMFIAISSSALYIVLIKFVFKQYEISEFTLSFYNNLLSIPFFLIMGVLRPNFNESFLYTLHAAILSANISFTYLIGILVGLYFLDTIS